MEMQKNKENKKKRKNTRKLLWFPYEYIHSLHVSRSNLTMLEFLLQAILPQDPLTKKITPHYLYNNSHQQ